MRSDDLAYLLHRPDGGSEPLPLVIFLHGAGERGDDLELVAVHGPPRQVSQGQELPFVMAAPQCPADTRWEDHQESLFGLIDELVATLPIDPDRVCLTGLSMGGSGTWSLAARQPGRFAAIAPICGRGDPATADRLTGLPIWAFHNTDDPIVPIAGTTGIVEAIEAAGGDIRATINPVGGHDAWTAAYDDRSLYDWLLDHRRAAVDDGINAG
ncbi:Alpha/beta hydrolase family protein [Microlunatus soli]|uniref:Alpha/beta hydrolase family protein n=2 Tax=Microlunatus soli TaxID=630515 RepID=A0A1H1SD54_9ACTN|nr:Alpha/beta hydrolase family protein [Microlunatus soli]